MVKSVDLFDEGLTLTELKVIENYTLTMWLYTQKSEYEVLEREGQLMFHPSSTNFLNESLTLNMKF